jgi:PAS domain S-box-containing protein
MNLSPRILIVEDELLITLDIKRRLTRLGYQVVGNTTNGEGALMLAEALRPDLVLMDIRLDGAMDGIEAAKQIGDRFHLPVAFLTAYAETATLERAKQANPFGYILKPVEDRELKTIIEIALYKHQAEQEIRRVNRLYTILSQVNQTIVRAATREEVFQRVCQIAVDAGSFKVAWVGWYNHQEHLLRRVAQAGDTMDAIGDLKISDAHVGGENLTIEAIRTGKACLCNDVSSDNQWQLDKTFTPQKGFLSLAAFPILMRGTTCAVLTLYAGEKNFFNGLETKLIVEITQDIAFALEHLDTETKRREAEENLRKSQANLARAESFSHIMVTHIALDGRWLKVPPLLCTYLGYTKDELLARRVQDVTHPEDAETDWQQYQKLLQSDLKAFSSEKRYRNKAGQILWFDVNTALVMNAQGNTDFFLTNLRDITESKRSMEKVRAQATLLDLTQDAIKVRDFQGHILYWNKGAEKLYGWTEVEVMGQDTKPLLDREDELTLKSALEQTRKIGQWNGEMIKTTKTGSQVTVQSRWTLLKNESYAPQSILIVDTDITERKQTEAQLLHSQRMDTIGALASGIAHDLNNILAPILMCAMILRKDCNSPENLSLLQTVEKCAQRGADIVGQLLSFSRGPSKKMLLNPRHLLKEIAQVAQETFPKSITLKTDIPKIPHQVNGDATQLHQLLLNLCVNARDAMPSGGTLTLHLEPIQLDQCFVQSLPDVKPGPYVLLSVKDTGVGIPIELREKIFEPLFTTKPPGKGTGLGLAAVKTIVKNHGGFVQVFSEINQGSEFKVYLPAVLLAESHDTTILVKFPPEGHGEAILVVDDEASVCAVIQRVLEGHAYEVLVANDGAQALGIFAQNLKRINAVLLDMVMPVMDGAATVKVLRKLKPDVKIIIASGAASPEQQAEVAKLGVQATILKPFTAEELLETVNRVLNGSSAKSVDKGLVNSFAY